MRLSFRTTFIFFLILDLMVFTLSCGVFHGVGFSNDNFNLGYPMRVLISTSFQNGIFPFWNHWSFGGSPLISVYSTAAMSPMVWLVSLFGVYNRHSFILEMILLHLLGFCGMYQWLKLHVKQDVALYGAITFALSAYMITQFPINIDGAANPSLYPWYAMGLTLALRGTKKGIAITALSLYALFTIGYLGTSVIAFQIISLFCLISFWKRDLRGIVLAAIAGGAFLVMFSPLIIETFSNQPLGYFTDRSIEPFIASARGRSFVSLLFPNHISPFVSDTYGGHWALLYTGIFSIFLMIYALCNSRQNRLVRILAWFVLFSFVAMLTSFNPLTRLIVAVIPFYNKIRFHIWNTGIVIFFSTTLAAIGLQMFLERESKSRLKVPAMIFFVSVIIAYIAKDEFKHWYDVFANSQLYFIPLYFLLLSSLVKVKSEVKVGVLSVLLLVELCLVKNDYVPFSPESVDYAEKATNGFPAPENARSQTNSMTDGNGHYLSKIPHLFSYTPQIHPLIADLLKKDLKNIDLLNNIISPAEGVEITKMDPSHLDASVEVATAGPYVWSSPYSPNWNLTINDQPATYIQNKFGLTEFILDVGKNQVSFHYLPKWFFISLAAAVITALWLLNLLFQRDKRSLEHGQYT